MGVARAFSGRYNMEGAQLVVEILKTVKKHGQFPGLRSEVYCQLMKQLTANPSLQSVSLVGVRRRCEVGVGSLRGSAVLHAA